LLAKWYAETGDGGPPLCGRSTRGKYTGFDRNFRQAIIGAEEKQVSYFFAFSTECKELKQEFFERLHERGKQISDIQVLNITERRLVSVKF
jgi:hypothetical protein